MKHILLALTLILSLASYAEEVRKPLTSLQQKIVNPLGNMIPIDEIDGAQFNTFLKTSLDGIFLVFPGLYSPPTETTYLQKKWTSYRVESAAIANLKTFIGMLPGAEGDAIPLVQYLLSQTDLIEYKYGLDKTQMLVALHFKKKIAGRSQALDTLTKGIIAGLEVGPTLEILITYIKEDKISIQLRGLRLIGSVVHRIELPEVFIDHLNGKMMLLENGLVVIKDL